MPQDRTPQLSFNLSRRLISIFLVSVLAVYTAGITVTLRLRRSVPAFAEYPLAQSEAGEVGRVLRRGGGRPPAVDDRAAVDHLPCVRRPAAREHRLLGDDKALLPRLRDRQRTGLCRR